MGAVLLHRKNQSGSLVRFFGAVPHRLKEATSGQHTPVTQPLGQAAPGHLDAAEFNCGAPIPPQTNARAVRHQSRSLLTPPSGVANASPLSAIISKTENDLTSSQRLDTKSHTARTENSTGMNGSTFEPTFAMTTSAVLTANRQPGDILVTRSKKNDDLSNYGRHGRAPRVKSTSSFQASKGVGLGKG